MSNKFNGFNHKYFVIVGEERDRAFNGGSITLRAGYYDHEGLLGESGRYVQYVAARDSKGQDIPKRFRLNSSFAKILTRDSDKDFYGVKQYDWLKNYPDCEGSPYGSYTTDQNGNTVQIGVVFRELNHEKDAETALAADKQRIEAQAKVLELDSETLQEVAAVLGHYGPPNSLMRMRVVEFAGKKPAEFDELMESSDRSLRALVRRAIAEDLFTKKGSMISWESTLLGADENAAIARLASDSLMVEAIRKRLGKFTEPIATEEPKKRGNPNFGKKKAPIAT